MNMNIVEQGGAKKRRGRVPKDQCWSEALDLFDELSDEFHTREGLPFCSSRTTLWRKLKLLEAAGLVKKQRQSDSNEHGYWIKVRTQKTIQ